MAEAARQPRVRPLPRYWTADDVAARLGKSAGWLRQRWHDLEMQGFPRPDPLLGYDSHAVEQWCDRRSGLNRNGPGTGSEEEKALAAILGW